jgi:hypothetical protein
MTAGHFPLEMVADDGVTGRFLRRVHDRLGRDRRSWDGDEVLATAGGLQAPGPRWFVWLFDNVA